MDKLLTDAGELLLSNGPLGLVVIGLVYYIMMQRSERRDENAAHKVELASKDKLIVELYDRLVTQAGAGLLALEAVQKPLEQLSRKLRESTQDKED